MSDMIDNTHSSTSTSTSSNTSSKASGSTSRSSFTFTNPALYLTTTVPLPLTAISLRFFVFNSLFFFRLLMILARSSHCSTDTESENVEGDVSLKFIPHCVKKMLELNLSFEAARAHAVRKPGDNSARKIFVKGMEANRRKPSEESSQKPARAVQEASDQRVEQRK